MHICVTSPTCVSLCALSAEWQLTTTHNQFIHSLCVCVRVCVSLVCVCVPVYIMTAISNTWWITHHHNLHNFEVFIALVRQLQ